MVGMELEFEVSKCELLYVGWIKNEVLLYNIGNYIPYPVIIHNGIEYKKEYKYICIYKLISLLQQKLTQFCNYVSIKTSFLPYIVGNRIEGTYYNIEHLLRVLFNKQVSLLVFQLQDPTVLNLSILIAFEPIKMLDT